MSTPQSTPTDAIAYLRRSTLRQEDSIEAQRAQIAEFAAREGFRVIREYTDEGIAGDEIDLRPGLQGLLNAMRRGPTRVVLMDAFSRLSRADPIETIADVIRPLKHARVKAYSVKDGAVAWDNLAELLLLTIKSSQSHEEARNLAYLVLRAARLGVSRGERRGSRPYGYRLDQTGGKKMGRAPGKLVIYEPEASVVRRIFALVIAGWSVHAIAGWLNSEGIPAPRGGRWNTSTLKQLLRNPVYAGHFRWGHTPMGKHWRLHNGKMIETDRLPEQVEAHDTWEVRRDAHPKIIDQETFDAAQDALDRRNTFRGKAVAPGGYPLSGMLMCGHCGRTLVARLDARGKPRYECQPTDNNGAVVCRHYGVRETVILGIIARSLRVSFTDPAVLEKVRAEVEAEAAAARAPAVVEALEKKLAARQADETRAARVLSLVPDDLIENVAGELRRLKEERKAVEEELKAAVEATAVVDLTEAIAAAGKALEVLDEALLAVDRQTVRDVLRPLIDHVELRWETTTSRNGSKKARYVLVGGRIVLSTAVDRSVTRPARPRRLALPLVVG